MVSRRQFFSQIGQALVTNVTDAIEQIGLQTGVFTTESGTGTCKTDSAATSSWLRPPGALPEPEFLKTCTQCTACQEACPYESIRRLGPEFDLIAGTPAIIASESPCYLCEDMPCITSCEPKALRMVARKDVRMGTAVVSMSKCYISAGQPCDYCVVRCPLGTDAIAFGKDGLPDVQVAGCSGCGVCDYLCPADAIQITPAYFKGTTDAN